MKRITECTLHKPPSIPLSRILLSQDLSVADPYVVLPTLSALSFLLMLEKGSDGMNSGMVSPNMRLAMRAVTFLIVPMTIDMPAGTFMYWLTSNGFSLAQSHVLRVRVPCSRVWCSLFLFACRISRATRVFVLFLIFLRHGRKQNAWYVRSISNSNRWRVLSASVTPL